MAKRKKKPSGYQLEAISKAHHKNEFLRKLKTLINNCCGEDIFSLIPPIFLNRTYMLRCHSLTIIPAGGNLIPVSLLNDLRRVLSAWLKKESLVLLKYNNELSIDDFLTVGLTTVSMGRILKDKDFRNAAQVKAALSIFCEDPEPYEEYYLKLVEMFRTIGCCLSTIGDHFYWLNYELELAENGKFGINNRVEIHKDIHQSNQITLFGKKRPVLRLGWANPCEGIEWIALSPSLLGNVNLVGDNPYPVYVQSHALIRLAERIDALKPSFAQYYMFLSFQNPKVSYDCYHNLLVEYRLFGVKTGYFRIDVVDGKVLVRTFLFLTQCSTPEGQLLSKNTGLQKLDTKYLALDKISSFMTTDMGKNLKIRKIFEDCGCKCLLELYMVDLFQGLNHHSQSTCDLMLDYLGYSDSAVPEEVSLS